MFRHVGLAEFQFASSKLWLAVLPLIAAVVAVTVLLAAAVVAVTVPVFVSGLFLPSEVSTPEAQSALQLIAAPEQDTASLESAVQSASAASDIFMLGGVTYEMLVGNPAFGAKDDGLGRAKRWQVLPKPQIAQYRPCILVFCTHRPSCHLSWLYFVIQAPSWHLS